MSSEDSPLQSGSKLPHSKDSKLPWPHAPTHRLAEAGTFIVTAATYQKAHLFPDGPPLRMLHRTLLELAEKHGWQLEAWAVFPNHYHFIAHSPQRAESLAGFLKELHSRTSIALNRRDRGAGRQVWQKLFRHAADARAFLPRAAQLRASERRASRPRAGGESVSVVLRGVVREDGHAGTGENDLRVQNGPAERAGL